MRAAFGFLTIVPLGDVRGPALARSVAWFPVVGLAVGLAAALFDAALAARLPALVVAPLDLAFLALASGGLHLDGLADTADGLFCRGDRERRLAVMRDPATGAFAVAGVALALMLEGGALASMTDRAGALVAASVLSRSAMACALVAMPYARASGVATAFEAGTRRARAIPSVVAIAATLALAGPALLLAPLAAVTVGLVSQRILGGATGDVYGAMGELSFAAALVASVGA